LQRACDLQHLHCEFRQSEPATPATERIIGIAARATLAKSANPLKFAAETQQLYTLRAAISF